MQFEELDDSQPMVAHLGVEPPGDDSHDFPVPRQLFADDRRRLLDQHQRRGFERFDETRRQPDRDAVANPEPLAVTRLESDGPIAEARGVDARSGLRDVGPQRGERGFPVRMGAGVDIADAAAAAQPDVPDPAMRLRGRDGHRSDRIIGFGVGNLRRDGPVVEQHILDRNQRAAAMGADQQRFLAGAIDEQIPRHALAGIERNRGDVSIGARLDCLDIAGDVAHAKFPDRVPMQQSGECAGIEVITIVDGKCVLRRARLLWREAKLDHPRLGGHQVGEAGASAMGEPELRRIELGVFQRQAEGMEVFRGFRQARPSAEPRALLEAGGAFADELILGEADSLERGAHRRPGAFAHADDGHIG